jgi:hypothetical protein
MSARVRMCLVGLLLTGLGTGCCRFCERWCHDRYQPNPTPAYLQAPMCVPICPPQPNFCNPCGYPPNPTPVSVGTPVPAPPSQNPWTPAVPPTPPR